MIKKRFNTVTFALPAQTFHIRCHVSMERAVPVMTEFAIRLLYVCGAMHLEQIRDYFGLDNREARELLNVLKAESLIEDKGEQVALTAFAMEKFEASTKESPRFTAILERNSRVPFELLTYQHLPREISAPRISYALDLTLPPDMAIDRTVEKAERAFIEQFHDIQKVIHADEEKRAVGVYKVDEITAESRFSIPYTIHFEVDEEGHTSYLPDKDLELSEELANVLDRLVSDTVGAVGSDRSGFANVSDFIRNFDDQVINEFSSPHATAYSTRKDEFSFAEYVKSVHVKRSTRYRSPGTSPFFGAPYVPENSEAIAERLKKALGQIKQDDAKATIHPTLFWIAPRHALWGRTSLLGAAIEQITKVGRASLGKSFTVCVVKQIERHAARKEAARGVDSGVLDLLVTDPSSVNSSFEILLLPGVFGVALCHTNTPDTIGCLAGIGFSTTNADTLDWLKRLTRRVLSNNGKTRYRRASKSDMLLEATVSDADFEYLFDDGE